MGGATAAHDARWLRCRRLKDVQSAFAPGTSPSHALDDAGIHQQLPDTP
jgi:hypothetical protein